MLPVRMNSCGRYPFTNGVWRPPSSCAPVAGRCGAGGTNLAEHVHVRLELLVRGERARLAEDLALVDVLLLQAAHQRAQVVAGLAAALHRS